MNRPVRWSVGLSWFSKSYIFMLLSEHVLDMLELLFYLLEWLRLHFLPGLGIYKREKKNSKKTRKHTLVQENMHSFKEKRTCSRKKGTLLRKPSTKKEKTYLRALSWSRACFLERVLFLNKFFFHWTSACFLEPRRVFLFSYFLFSFINS